MIQFELPYPIPLASLWKKHKGGGVPFDRYRAYGHDAYEAMLKQRPRKFKGAVSVVFDLKAPTKQLRDGDNLLKCLFDTPSKKRETMLMEFHRFGQDESGAMHKGQFHKAIPKFPRREIQKAAA